MTMEIMLHGLFKDFFLTYVSLLSFVTITPSSYHNLKMSNEKLTVSIWQENIQGKSKKIV